LRASGLIIAATGRCTRLLPFVEAKDKCYSFRLHLGYETDTLEWDGEVVAQDERAIDMASAANCTLTGPRPLADECSLSNSQPSPNKDSFSLRDALKSVLPQFVGDIEQVPPKYCAVKINGVRASDLMERGRNIELKPRKIRISELKVIGEGNVTEGCSGKEFATFDLICECSKGTYIRALGRDIGRALGTYACVSQIRRHRIGNVTLDKAVRGEDLTRENLLPVDAVLDFPVVRLTDEQVAVIRQGNWLPWKEKIEGVGPEGHVFAANMQGEVLSLCFYEPGRIKPKFYLGEDK
jgi:tRNA pseudouridine55 synthase